MKKIVFFVACAALAATILTLVEACTGDSEIDHRLARLWVSIAEGELKVRTDHTTASWTPFATALEDAKSVASSSSPTLTAINTAITTLEQAMAGLVNTVVARQNLSTAISVSEAWKNNGYTTASWDAFQSALADARTVRDNAEASADRLDTALKKLMASFNGLVTAGSN